MSVKKFMYINRKAPYGTIYALDDIHLADHARYNYTPSAVPVPAAAWLFGSGLIGLVGIARRRKTA